MHRSVQTAALAVALLVSVAGCGQVAPGGAGSPTTVPVAVGTDVPAPVETGRSTPLPLPTGAGPSVGAPVPTDTAAPAGLPPTPGTVLQSHTARVPVGQAYAFSLYTHCGIDFAVDFDGSFWDLLPLTPAGDGQGNPSAGIGNPMQQGTMTLLDATHARFTYSGGVFEFTRHVGPKIVPGLCM